ncbi:MAG TPA: GNAT family N-acetyltransferase [Treponemataceae bacterium]|nr:GNAT family N-acetyltransferase [Treponemataceae bacterium]
MHYVPLMPDLFESVFHFVKPKEYLCTALTECLLHYKKNMSSFNNATQQESFFVLFNDSSDVCGILCLSHGGRALHHFSNASILKKAHDCTCALLNQFYGKHSPYTLHCIVGIAIQAKLLAVCARDAGLGKIGECREYKLMVYESRAKVKKTTVLKDVVLKKCSLSDAPALYNLQKGYDIEEVLPKGAFYNELAGQKILEKSLKNQMVYALFKKDNINGKAIAKVGTNAIGFNWCQFGGVYTEPEFRNKGCARYLVSYMAKTVEKSGYGAVLFVQKKNTAAIRAYSAVGFFSVEEFKIIYF